MVESIGRYCLCLIVTALMMFEVNASEPEPKRIVSIGGSITEIIYALNMQSHIVAVDSSSLWPLAAIDHPQVGYQRALSAEGVLSLTPDLVLATEDAGPEEVLSQLKHSGIKVTILQNKPDMNGVLAKVRSVAKAIGKIAEGEQLVNKTRSRMQKVKQQIDQISKKPKVIFLFSAGRSGPMVSGSNTAADGMIDMAGGVNAIGGFQGYKPLNTEAMVVASPDVVITTERSLKTIGGLEKLMQLPGIRQTPAGVNGQVYAMDGLLLLGLSPRSPEAIAMLARLIHPDIDIDE